MLQVFHVDAAKVDQDVVYVAMSIHMLQPSVRNFSSIFLNVCCKCVYLNIAYVSHICYKCFIWMLCMFYMVFKCFLDVFESVSDACFKCFICLQTHVASVASGCFKSRSGVAARSLLAFDCLASVSPPSLGASWASELEA